MRATLGCILFLTLFALVAPAAARPPMVHAVVRCDLDAIAVADDLAALLDTAADQRELVVLELTRPGWRLDVVWAIARAIRDSGAEVTIWLNPEGDRVGEGALLLAIIADASAIAPDASLASTPADDARTLAPKSTDWEQVEREMSGLLWVALDRRGLDPALAEDLLVAEHPLWANRRGVDWTLSGVASGDDSERFLTVHADLSHSLSARASVLRDLRLVDDLADSPRLALLEQGINPGRLRRVVLESNLSGARARVERLLAQFDEALYEIDAALDRVRYPIDDRVVPNTEYIAAGRTALRDLRAAEALLERAEELFARHPELIRTESSEGTPVGRSAARNAADWRASFTNRRRDLDRLRDRAEDYARR
ncbi:MAG: hypothetical protein ACF8SC_05930 [Phycisphaerales bacterium JB037]